TPGLVELGAVEDAENRRYGEHAAKVCDEVIIVAASPTRALREGLRAGGFDDAHVHVVDSLAEATAVIGRVSRSGDVVLFANDLPDPYLAGR
ncbi:MAG TPA: UDP-N-acetylmuramoyl-tripeptide--D-alanyl-D-alanine ligase, partial [Dehalococcoidia bacterium]|nr:UDP-N-acetylmuramoyl-tripeptide--D-alanyl-D-alanine ligase [Dehalococcoidia bacterium]